MSLVVKFCPAKTPNSNLKVVPDSRIETVLLGFDKPNNPLPIISTVFNLRLILIPSLLKIEIVARQSLLTGKFSILVLPTARALKITARWAIDLSAGREIFPLTPETGRISKPLIYFFKVTLSPSEILSLSALTKPAADIESCTFSTFTSPAFAPL